MGADLYNDNYLHSTPELLAVHDEMQSYLYGADGKYRKMTEEEHSAYTELYDKLYNDPRYYFRESYGGGGLLQLMDLSWWQDVIPLQDIHPPEGLTEEEVEAWYEENPNNMSPEACERFRVLLQSRRAIVDAYPDDEWEEGTDFFTGEHYRTNVGEWYRARLERLLEFLRGGVEYGGINASL